jgi:PAS domain S-box-containing protein
MGKARGQEPKTDTDGQLLQEVQALRKRVEELEEALSLRSEAEDILLESEGKLAVLFETIADGICISDLQGNVLDVNAAYLEMFGYSQKEEIVGRNVAELIAEEDRPKVADQIAKTLEAESGPPTLYNVLHSNGSVCVAETSAALIRNAAGNPTGLVAIVKDITKRRQVQEALEKSEERFRALVERGTDGILLLDRAGAILYGTPSLTAMLGYEEGSADGLSFPRFLHPEDLDKAIELFGRLVENPEGLDRTELRIRHEDGSWRNVEILGTNKLNDPAVEAVVINVHDVTERKWAEDRLQETRRRYQAVFNNSMYIVYVIDDQGIILDANDWGIERMGLTRQELGNISFQDLVHPEDLPKALASQAETMSKGYNEHPAELRVFSKSGEEIWVEASASYLEHEGEGRRALGVAQDITERILAEAALRASEERYRLLADNITDVIFTTDLNLQLTYMSPSVIAQRGFTPEEATTMPLEDHITPASLEKAMQILSEELAIEERADKDLFRTRTEEFEVYRKDGSTFWAEWRLSFLRNEGGQATGILGSSRDVTARKQVEEALRGSERRFRSIIENAHDGITLISADGITLYESPSVEGIIGRKPEQMVGVPMHQDVHPDDLPIMAERFAKIIGQPGATEAIRLRVRHSDGSWRWIEGTGTNLLHDPALQAIVCNYRDVTEHKLAEEALTQSEEKYRLLTESMSEVVWATDASLFFTYVSPSFERQTGYSAEEAAGLTPMHLMAPDSLDQYHSLSAAISEELSGGPRGPGGETRSWTVEAEVVGKDGSTYWGETTINILRNALGEAAGVMGVARDITERRQAVEAVRDSEEKYRSLVENSSDHIFMVNREGTVLSLNTTASKLLGQRPDDIIGKNVRELFPEEVASQYMSSIEKTFETDVGHTYESVLPQGEEEIWISTSLSPVKDQNQNTIAVQGSARDITDRKRMEEALRTGEEKYRVLVDNLDYPLTVYDSEGRLSLMNAAGARNFGLSPEDFVGRSLHDFFPGTADIFVERARQVIESGIGREFEDEVPLPSGKGWFYSNIQPLKDVSGNIVAVQTISQDITERRQAEEALRQSEDRFRSLFEYAPDAYYLNDLAGSFTDGNRASEELTGYHRDELVGRNMFEIGILPPEELPKAMDLAGRSAQGEPTGPDELPLIRKDGSTVWVEICTYPMKIGGEGRVLGIARDITERKRIQEESRQHALNLATKNIELDAMRQELSQLNRQLEEKVRDRTAEVERLLKQKNDFIGQLGHDLKSPLTPLATLLPLIREEKADHEQQVMLDSAIESVTYMRELVAKTLKLAKLNSASIVGSLATVDLSQYVDRVIRGRNLMAQGKDIGTLNKVEGGICVEADELGLQELLDNLLSNAMRFTPSGGSITFEAEQNEHTVTVSVRDTGAGMTEEQLSRIFDEFYKGDSSKHELESSGLGLAICRRIVENHGGNIWAESEGPGRGSTLSFTLRRANALVEPEPAASQS